MAKNFEFDCKKASLAKRLKAAFLMTFAMSLIPVCSEAINSGAEAKPLVQAFRLPDTPFLPPYSGRIVYGDVSTIPQTDGGIAYVITFETAEKPEQVLTWYKSAFEIYKWNIAEDASAQYRLRALHGKNVASNIFLLSPRKTGSNAQVQLYYRYGGREI